jgi:hypothetical protein
MPHRKALGDQAADQRAESVLGRLVLRGLLDPVLGLAGQTYLTLWQGYVRSLAGPRAFAAGSGHGMACDGCPDPAARKFCRCYFRKKIFLETRDLLLQQAGAGPEWEVRHVVIHDHAPIDFTALRNGLAVLAAHWRLTPRPPRYTNAASENVQPPS